MFQKIVVSIHAGSRLSTWVDFTKVLAVEAQHNASGQLHQVVLTTITGNRINFGVQDGAADLLAAFQAHVAAAGSPEA